MKATLMIEAAPSVLAQILANLPDGASVSVAPMPTLPPVASDDEEDDNAPVNTAAPAVDSSGLPWDARIHAGTKGITGKGLWKLLKGGPKGPELAAIEASLRAAQPAPVAAPAPVATPAPVAAPMTPPPAMPAPVPVTPVAPPPMPPVVEAAPVAAPEPAPVPTGVVDFAAFMGHMATQMAKQAPDGSPLVNPEYLSGLVGQINTAWAAHGIALASITDIQTDQRLIDYAIQLMQRDGRWS